MVLGKLPVPGRPTIWIIVGQGPTALAVGAGGGCLDIFTLICPFSSLSPKTKSEILSQRAAKHKTTNQPTVRDGSGGAMVLGKLPVPGRLTFWIVGKGLLRLQ